MTDYSSERWHTEQAQAEQLAQVQNVSEMYYLYILKADLLASKWTPYLFSWDSSVSVLRWSC